MKSQIKMDVDYNNHPILSIKNIQSDDIRDKSVYNYLNKFNQYGEYYLKVTKRTFDPRPETPANIELTVEPISKERYLDGLLGGTDAACSDDNHIRKENIFFKYVGIEDRDDYLRPWPSSEPLEGLDLMVKQIDKIVRVEMVQMQLMHTITMEEFEKRKDDGPIVSTLESIIDFLKYKLEQEKSVHKLEQEKSTTKRLYGKSN